MWAHSRHVGPALNGIRACCPPFPHPLPHPPTLCGRYAIIAQTPRRRAISHYPQDSRGGCQGARGGSSRRRRRRGRRWRGGEGAGRGARRAGRWRHGRYGSYHGPRERARAFQSSGVDDEGEGGTGGCCASSGEYSGRFLLKRWPVRLALNETITAGVVSRCRPPAVLSVGCMDLYLQPIRAKVRECSCFVRVLRRDASI